MKKLFVILAIFSLSYTGLADDKYGYQKRDWLDKDKINTYYRYGNKTGYLKRDWLDKDKINSYDSRGHLLGHQKKDWLNKNKLNLYANARSQIQSEQSSG